MSQQKVRLSYGGGSDTPILSLSSNKFYLYGKDREVLHTTYGGRQYYESRSGASGAGFLQPSAGENDLIVFGYYRTDARSEQHMETVGYYHPSNANSWDDARPIFGYAPIDYRAGSFGNGPFVLSDGETVAFTWERDVLDTLKDWNKVREEAVEKPFVVYDPSSADAVTLTLRLSNPHKIRGVNPLRFFDLRSWRTSGEVRNDLVDSRVSVSQMNLVKAEQLGFDGGIHHESVWLHRNQLGVFDAKLEIDPLKVKGEIVDGWAGDGRGLVWNRRGFVIRAILEVRLDILTRALGLHFEWDETAPEWMEFEEDIPVTEWFSLKPEERRNRLMVKLCNKVLKEAEAKLARQGQMEILKSLMQSHPMLPISISDSLESGNCRPGTERFLEEFKLPEETTIGELLRNEKFDEMFDRSEFRKVIAHALQKNNVNFSILKEIETSSLDDDNALLGENTLARLRPQRKPVVDE